MAKLNAKMGNAGRWSRGFVVLSVTVLGLAAACADPAEPPPESGSKSGPVNVVEQQPGSGSPSADPTSTSSPSPTPPAGGNVEGGVANDGGQPPVGAPEGGVSTDAGGIPGTVGEAGP